MAQKILYLTSLVGVGILGLQLVAWCSEIDTGRDLYLRYCSSCHGKDGKGDGLVSPFLKIELPDLSLLKKDNKGLFPFSDVMASIDGSRVVRGHGDPAMPVWGELFRKELETQKYQELTSLLKVKIIAEYISTLQR